MVRSRLRAYVDVETLKDGSVALTLRHPRGRAVGGQWAKFKIKGGGNLIARAVTGVYDRGEDDADAFFEAHGMSDEEAFKKETWR